MSSRDCLQKCIDLSKRKDEIIKVLTINYNDAVDCVEASHKEIKELNEQLKAKDEEIKQAYRRGWHNRAKCSDLEHSNDCDGCKSYGQAKFTEPCLTCSVRYESHYTPKGE